MDIILCSCFICYSVFIFADFIVTSVDIEIL